MLFLLDSIIIPLSIIDEVEVKKVYKIKNVYKIEIVFKNKFYKILSHKKTENI